jgi:uncharacterized protein (DUF2141 family)
MSCIRLISIFTICAICFTPLSSAFAQEGAAPPAGTITLQISGIEKLKGELRCRLYNIEENFPSKEEEKMFRLIKLPVESGTASVSIDKLPFGKYAVIVHQDLNANGKMDCHWYGPPAEPVACSNGATGSFGPPKWSDAVFEFNRPELIIPIEFR